MVLYSRHEEVLHAEVNGDVVVMNPETLDYFELEGVAPRIWEILQAGPMTAEAVADVLVQEFDIDNITCERAVSQFLNSAVENGVVVQAES